MATKECRPWHSTAPPFPLQSSSSRCLPLSPVRYRLSRNGGRMVTSVVLVQRVELRGGRSSVLEVKSVAEHHTLPDGERPRQGRSNRQPFRSIRRALGMEAARTTRISRLREMNFQCQKTEPPQLGCMRWFAICLRSRLPILRDLQI